MTMSHDLPPPSAPFDTALLDQLMEAAGIDLLLVTSKHNVQYLLGGHRALFFDYMDAMGVSRYVPVLVYSRGAAERTGYIGHRTETNQKEVTSFWVSDVQTTSWGSVDAIEKAVAFMQKQGFKAERIGIETSFLPFDSGETLRRLLPDSTLVDALELLERLRMRKSPAEVSLLREASERLTQAMAEVLRECRPGLTKRQVVDALRQAETARGLTFEYCLITAGIAMNRAPSNQVLQAGDIMSLDSGANYHGYIGDICRMAILGEPDAELVALLGFIEDIQQAAFRAIVPGALGSDVYAAAHALLDSSPFAAQTHFVAHGMGLVTHEAPHLTKSGPVPYPDDDARLPLQAGMVLSIETTLRHPGRGFIKLEDTVGVTATGAEVFGNTLRGWNRAGPPKAGSLAA